MSEENHTPTICVIPLLFMVASVLGAISYYLGIYFGEKIFVNPSSTAALNIFVLPITIGLVLSKIIKAGIIGLLLGSVIGSLMYLLRLKTIFYKMVIYTGIILVIIAMLFGGAFGFLKVKKYNTPGIIYTNSDILKTIVTAPKIIKNSMSIPFKNRNREQLIRWNGKEVRLSFDSNIIKIKTDDKKGAIVETSLEKYDYISEITPVEVRFFQNDENYLVLLADLRATSWHVMLLIYSPQGQLIYQEMLERKQSTIQLSANTLEGENREELLLENDSLFSYSSKVTE
ncbi:MAG: hypothetical protein FVQ80_06005 [Planctomycetes bacterium]|nr:hypothetical protein [Planctomycetota bacterium]